MKLEDAVKFVLEGKKEESKTPDKEADGEINPNAKQALQRRTKVIINPPLVEKKEGIYNPLRNKNNPDNDPSRAVSDPFKVLGEPDASVELKDLAFKLIKARSFDESEDFQKKKFR